MLVRVENVLEPAELASIRERLASANFSDGAGTAGSLARTVKRNLQLPPDSPVAADLSPVVLQALQRSYAFNSAALPRQISPLLFNRYDTGMEYGPHIDNAFMGGAARMRSDIACTLFLSEPAEYEGGELEVRALYGGHSVRLAAGQLIVYPASSLHRVVPVTRGARLAVVFWVQSLVRDPERRRVLFDVELVIQRLRASAPGHPEIASLVGIYHNLLRLWTEY